MTVQLEVEVAGWMTDVALKQFFNKKNIVTTSKFGFFSGDPALVAATAIVKPTRAE